MIKLILSSFLIFTLSLTNTEVKDNLQIVSDIPNTQGEKVKILTWNIQDLGKTKDENEIHQIAQAIRNYDIVAIQEVVAKDPAGAKSIAKIADELNRMGSKWEYRVSNPTQSPSVYMSERYAYLWKTSRVKIIGAPYLDNERASTYVREPYIAKFKTKKGTKPFYVINFHSIKRADNPQEEIKHFTEYQKRLDTKRLFILGDFNLDEKHNVWNGLYDQGFESAIEYTPTTLKKKCKKGIYLHHSTDNIYFHPSEVQKTNSGVIDLVKDCSNLLSTRALSDHLPVFIECIISEEN